MHRHHDHTRDYHHDHDHIHDHHHDHEAHRWAGHNHAQPRSAAQWQTPHLPQGESNRPAHEPDLDKVETAFIESFFTATDQASFLRLARIPFEIVLTDGVHLKLLRVEVDALTDVGSLTPHLGGESLRYDPLPSGLISQRRRLRFAYFDGKGLRQLTFAEARNPAGIDQVAAAG